MPKIKRRDGEVYLLNLIRLRGEGGGVVYCSASDYISGKTH